MSNKITFSNASNAKLSCKLKQNDKEVTDLKKKLTKMVKEVNTNICTDCNK